MSVEKRRTSGATGGGGLTRGTWRRVRAEIVIPNERTLSYGSNVTLTSADPASKHSNSHQSPSAVTVLLPQIGMFEKD